MSKNDPPVMSKQRIAVAIILVTAMVVYTYF